MIPNGYTYCSNSCVLLEALAQKQEVWILITHDLDDFKRHIPSYIVFVLYLICDKNDTILAAGEMQSFKHNFCGNIVTV